MANTKKLAAVTASAAAFLALAGAAAMPQASAANQGFTIRYKVTVQQPGLTRVPWCMGAIDGNGQKVYPARCSSSEAGDYFTTPEHEVSYPVTTPAKQYYVDAQEFTNSLVVTCTVYRDDQVVATDTHNGSCMASYFPKA